MDVGTSSPMRFGAGSLRPDDIADWFAENAGKTSPAFESLLKYSTFGEDDESSDLLLDGGGSASGGEAFGSPFSKEHDPNLDSSSLHFSLTRLSFQVSNTGASTKSCSDSDGDSPSQRVTVLRKRRPRRTKETPEEKALRNSRERSQQYSQSLRKESARKRKLMMEKASPGPGTPGSLSSSHTSLPKISGLAKGESDLDASKGSVDGGVVASLEDTFTSSVGLGLALESLSEGQPLDREGLGLSQQNSASGTPMQSRRGSMSRKFVANNRITPNTNPMSGVISKQDSGVWSVDSAQSTPEGKSLLKLKATTPTQSSLDPWMENEAKRENEALIADFEDELRYKIRNLAVEYDRLQFRALEGEELIKTQRATIKLKNKTHKKELKHRQKLLKREAEIKEMIAEREEDRFVIIARRMIFKHILQRVAKLHVETYKKVQEKQKEVEEEVGDTKLAKKEQVKIKTSVNAAKIQKFKWLQRHEEERKRKQKMLAFKRNELAKLKKQSKKMGLVTESQIINTNFLGLITTVQNANMDKVEDSTEVDKTTSTMVKLHKLYKVTDTTNADEVVSVWNKTVEGLINLRNEKESRERMLADMKADKLALHEDLELLHLTGKGIFMERNEEVRHITLQAQLDNDLAGLETKAKSLYKVKKELRIIYQGILNMLKKMKANAPEQLNVLNENVLSSLKHPINIDQIGSVPEEMDPQDVAVLFKHFEDALTALNRLNVKGHHTKGHHHKEQEKEGASEPHHNHSNHRHAHA
ncbi:hypothetical protein HOP50_20g86170 [Chloropicon primus]|uniref:Uncharacterized protein n=1 Tax=Chloropicon primus TaxID=1764295 RepID=A0A5B8N197_9CHLO|nr:hypothetical protein A3770_20p85840 [Chloropicon primus]UPR05267.1 hypothetical protein HOP50_20g86170 [Chloropicon primus]|eukprot:QDZ26066.1 hypothetical protein A3770_20p85840 [Chloropicon primus]